MFKFGLIFLVVGSILFLGLTWSINGFDPYRDPVPDSQKVAHSSHCAGCHGYDESGLALVDSEGNDVNIFDDWQASMMALSAYDPFWRATLAHEVNLFPSAQYDIEQTCLKCHAPLGSIQSRLSGQNYSYGLMLQDSLGLDGVSCSSCHLQSAENLGQSFSGDFMIDTHRVLYGPYANPFKGPMQIYVGFEPEFSDHIYSSGICAGCHTLITETLDEEGTPTGSFFVEQATYHEWLNSVYPAQGKECQACHMPFIMDSVVIASDILALEKRHPYGLHQFFGANTAMLSMMKNNEKLLDLPPGLQEDAWNESIENNRKSLAGAAEILISSTRIENDTLYFDVTIKNKTGHKLPSGYPSRLAWLEVILLDELTGNPIYSSGVLDSQGHITGRDHPFEPHHQVSRSGDDVQIYEMVMSDLHGQLTTSLNAAYQPLKDNRLLPLGFRLNHTTYDTVAIWGEATLDPDYGNESQSGQDIIEYRLPLQGEDGYGDLNISLRYLSLPARWMNDLFTNDTLAPVDLFKSIYDGYEVFDEVIDQISIDHIDLSTTSISTLSSGNSFVVFPNPLTGNSMNIQLTGSFQTNGDIWYELIDIYGIKKLSGKWSATIEFDSSIQPGLYYFIIYDNQKLIGLKPLTILNTD